MVVAWLAIAGVPPFSGFWSKDEILTYALHQNVALYLVGLFTALLTAFYMSRQVFMVFYGGERWNDRQVRHLGSRGHGGLERHPQAGDL